MKYLLFIFLIIFSSCSSNDSQEFNENNSSLILERSGMYTLQEFAFQRYELTQNKLNVKIYASNGSLTSEGNFNISSNQSLDIFNYLNSINFESLNSSYNSDVLIADVGQGVFIYNNKSIEINPYIPRGNPQEISDLIDKFKILLSSQDLSSLYKLNSNSNEVVYTYQGVQCITEPWQDWYLSGEINYIKEPSEKQLIIDYYAFQGVEIKEVNLINSDLITCQACEVCAKSYSYEILTNSESIILDNDGWKLN